MSEFILVHGSWHGAWCWREVIPRLEAHGHRVTAMDLPGHGTDPAPPERVTLQDYVSRVVQEVEASKGSPVLVGHSMGLVALVAEQLPDKIRALVFIASLLPPSGNSMMHLFGGLDPEYLAQIEFAPDGRTARLNTAGLRNFFYNCSPAGLAETVFPLLCPEPVAPFEAPFVMTPRNFGRVSHHYIECLRDRIVPLAQQRAIRAPFTFESVHSIDTDHMPLLSAPDELTAILQNIATKA